MLTRILSIFSKKNKIISTETNYSPLTITADPNKVLWKPNDKLYKDYNDYIDSVSSYKKYNIQLNDFILKKERLLKLYEDPTISNFDKILYNQEIIDISDQITIINNKINRIDQNNDILEKWNNYMSEAHEFLKTNQMDEFITTKDILCSINIVHLTKKCKDQITHSKRTNENEHTIVKLLETNIDKKSVDTRDNLLDFSLKTSELLKNNNSNLVYQDNYYATLR